MPQPQHKVHRNETMSINLFKEWFSFFLGRHRESAAAASGRRRPRGPRRIADTVAIIAHVVHPVQVNLCNVKRRRRYTSTDRIYPV